MLELTLIILAVLAVTYGAFLAIRLALPIFASVFASVLSLVYFFANIMLIFALIQAAAWIVFYPPLKSYFNGVAFSMLQIVTVVVERRISEILLFETLLFERLRQRERYTSFRSV